MIRKILIAWIVIFISALSALATEYILSSTPDGKGPIKVDDDIIITLETSDAKITLIDDEDNERTEISPIIFTADEGDKLTIEAKDYPKTSQTEPSFHGYKELSPLYLVNARTGRAICIFGGIPKNNTNWNGETETFVTLSYTIGTPMKLYCFSSSPTTCRGITIDDDLSLFNLSTNSTSLEMRPDTDGELTSEMMLNVAIPITEETPSIKIELSNLRGDAYVSPIYLVPVDGRGKAIPILDHEVRVEGRCEEDCQETIFYSYEGPLQKGQYLENELFYVEFFPPDDPEYYGFWVDLILFGDQAPLYIFFNSGNQTENTFLTYYGLRTKGTPVTIDSSFTAPVFIPKEMPFEQNLLIAGNYTVYIADTTGRFIYPYNFAIDTLEEDIDNATVTGADLTLSNIPEAIYYFDSDTNFILQAISESTLTPDKTVILDSSGNSTVKCVVNRVDGNGTFENGFLPKPISYTDYKVFFVTNIYCSNSTDQITPPLNSITAEITTDEGSISLISYRSFSSSNGTGVFYVFEYPFMDITDAKSIRYRFNIKLTKPSGGSVSLNSATYEEELRPAKYTVESAPNYTLGAKVDFNVSTGGYLYTYVDFAIKVQSTDGAPIDPEDLEAYVIVTALNGTDIYRMAKIEMTYTEDGVFKSALPWIVEFTPDSNAQTITYYFMVTDKSGDAVTGQILQNTFQLSLDTSNVPIAARIGGDRNLVLGEKASYSFFVRTGDVLSTEDIPIDVFIGLYKKGRGIVWLINKIPGAWVLSTSAKKAPIVKHVPFSKFRDGRYMFIDLDLPTIKDLMGVFYVGDYEWILRVENAETHEKIIEVDYPFSIKTP